MTEKKDKQLEPFTIDIVKRLRLEGKSDEANKLIQQYLEHVKKERKNDKHKQKILNQKIRRFKYRQEKLCIYCQKRLQPDKLYCTDCYRKYKFKNHCIDCNRLIYIKVTRCMPCNAKHRYKK